MNLKEFKLIELSYFKNMKSVNYFNNDASKLLYVESPAINVFRDFKEHKALTISEDASLLDIKKTLFDKNKDFILVTNLENQITGTISLHYLESVAVQKRAQAENIKIVELVANDIKLHMSEVKCMSYLLIQDAKIGHILNTLINSNCHHIIVYDKNAKNEQYIRGYFSLSHIRRKLDIEVHRLYQKDGVANIYRGI